MPAGKTPANQRAAAAARSAHPAPPSKPTAPSQAVSPSASRGATYLLLTDVLPHRVGQVIMVPDKAVAEGRFESERLLTQGAMRLATAAERKGAVLFGSESAAPDRDDEAEDVEDVETE